MVLALVGILLECILDGHDDEVVSMVAVRCTMATSTGLLGIFGRCIGNQLN